MPVRWPENRLLEWAPPGHGDLYTSIATSGMLRQLLKHDYRYAFVSNSDNLGATLDETILAWFAGSQIPFLMEVADRTAADRKGGHLARLRGDGLALRESAQTPAEDLPAFQDVTRHRYFNTNNLWLDLQALAQMLASRDGVLGLPLIVNRKPVDPSDPSSPEVIQLESAMGAAIGVFEDARAARSPSPVRAGQDDRRFARGAVGRLRAHRRGPCRARAPTGRAPSGGRARSALLQAPARLRGSISGRPAVARGV